MILLILACIGPTFDEETAAVQAGEGDGAVDDSAAPPVVTDCAEAVELSLEAPAAPLDQCDAACFTVQVTCAGAPLVGVEVAVEAEGLGYLFAGETDLHGQLAGCATALGVGELAIAATARVGGQRWTTYDAVDLRPFGYRYGLDRPVALPSDIALVPALARDPENPLLTAGPAEAWDDAGVLLPAVVSFGGQYLMYYAGSAATDYEVGLATSADGRSWSRYAGNPLFPAELEVEGSWQRYATNSPGALVVDGTVMVWYTGRSTETGDLAIGLVTSPDGVHFSPPADNPVFSPDPANEDWEANGVAHPSLVYRDGFFELWYSTGAHHLGYALSTDGITWERSCMGPVLSADAIWEEGQVKSADVIWTGDAYYMAYAGGQSGDFQVGWATSYDGQRWVRLDEPLLSPGPEDSWEENSVLGTSTLIEGDTMKMWYSGTSRTGSGVGLASGSFAP